MNGSCYFRTGRNRNAFFLKYTIRGIFILFSNFGAVNVEVEEESNLPP